MDDVVKLLRPVTKISVIVWVILSVYCPIILAQNTEYAPLERCAALPGAAPAAAFDGVLVTVGADAARAFRAGVSTTYVLSFAGGNFLGAGSVSPDGRHYAVPNGIISTITAGDVRYVVQEIRVLTTETVPRIVRRLPWRASFPVGTLFTSYGDIPAVRWLDETTVQFVSGTISEGQTMAQVDVFADEAAEPTSGYGLAAISPDNLRAITAVGGEMALIDALSGEVLNTLPRLPRGTLQAVWSPDSRLLALADIAEDGVSLRLYDQNGEVTATLANLPVEQVLWNLRWSPDGTKIAFTAFDPQRIENRLHIADLEKQTVTDTCLPLLADVDGSPLGVLAWSPDSTRLAIMTEQAAPNAQIQIYTVTDRSRYNLIPAAGRLLGWYP